MSKYLLLDIDEEYEEGYTLRYGFVSDKLESIIEHIKNNYREYRKNMETLGYGYKEIGEYVESYRLFEIKKEIKIFAIENNLLMGGK